MRTVPTPLFFVPPSPPPPLRFPFFDLDLLFSGSSSAVMIVYFWCQPAEKEAEEKRRNFLATFSPLPVTVLFSPQTKTHTQPDPIELHVASFSSFSLFRGYRRSSRVEAEKGIGGNKKSLITFLSLLARVSRNTGLKRVFLLLREIQNRVALMGWELILFPPRVFASSMPFWEMERRNTQKERKRREASHADNSRINGFLCTRQCNTVYGKLIRIEWLFLTITFALPASIMGYHQCDSNLSPSEDKKTPLPNFSISCKKRTEKKRFSSPPPRVSELAIKSQKASATTLAFPFLLPTFFRTKNERTRANDLAWSYFSAEISLHFRVFLLLSFTFPLCRN